MACSSCWKPKPAAPMFGDATEPRVGANGIIALRGYEDCTHPYRGPLARESVYIVGWNTDRERVFLVGQARAAVAYQATIQPRPHIHSARVTSLCAQAVEAIFGVLP